LNHYLKEGMWQITVNSRGRVAYNASQQLAKNSKDGKFLAILGIFTRSFKVTRISNLLIYGFVLQKSPKMPSENRFLPCKTQKKGK
jgi:hypothetical protein